MIEIRHIYSVLKCSLVKWWMSGLSSGRIVIGWWDGK